MKESGQPITIDNTAGVVKITPEQINLLAALTPVFAGWTQNPGTSANIVDELSSAVLTTQGIGAAGNNTIIYDLGSSRRRIIYTNCSAVGAMVQISDGGAYQTVLGDGTVVLNTGNTALGKFQYVKFLLVGIQTFSYLKMRCYNIN